MEIEIPKRKKIAKKNRLFSKSAIKNEKKRKRKYRNAPILVSNKMDEE